MWCLPLHLKQLIHTDILPKINCLIHIIFFSYILDAVIPEDHTSEQLARFKAGFELLIEQSIIVREHKEQYQSVHANLQNPLQRLLAMMRVHQTKYLMSRSPFQCQETYM